MTTTTDQVLHEGQPTVTADEAIGRSSTLGQLGRAIRQSIIAFIVATVFLILALLLVVNRQNALSGIAEQSSLANQFYIDILSMQQAEREYILTGEDTYLVTFNERYEAAQTRTEKLLTETTLSESERITLSRLQSNAQIFNRLFLQLANALNTRGFNIYQDGSVYNTLGLQSLKYARVMNSYDSKTLENTSEEAFLKLQLAESDFRGEVKNFLFAESKNSAALAQKNIETYLEAVEKSTFLSSADKQLLQEITDDYLKYFLQYVALTNEIERLNGDTTVAAHAAQYMIPAFTEALAERQQKITEQLFYTLATVAIVLIAIFLYVVYQLRRAQTSTNDTLAETIAAQQKAEAENERLNDSVINILEAVNALSQRDLRVRAPVTQDIVGTVSDSINALADETARVLGGVTSIAGRVSAVSDTVKSQAMQVSVTAAEERKNVDNMTEALLETTQVMNQVAALAEQTNESADQASSATNGALQTVNETVTGMDGIRQTISETEKRIKRLGERSQEISGIVNLINTISERTHVLALNASMQAAVAGEAGRGFAVVAQEVQQLAESSRNATNQIATLVSNIQTETNETINTVNKTITQVVEGSEQARRAGAQMSRTQEITADLVASIASIARASQQQKTLSAQLLEAIQAIGESTERTAQQIAAQNSGTDDLQKAAADLVASVNVFKLPPAQQH